MFVAITLGAALIRKETIAQVNVFLSPLCVHFLHVFFLCCMTAVPGTHPALIAWAAILSAVWRLTKMPKNCSILREQSKKEDIDIDFSDWVLLVYFPSAVYLALIAAGIGFLSGKSWAVCVLAISCLALLLGTVRGAWDTLVWIAVAVRAKQDGPAEEGKDNARPAS